MEFYQLRKLSEDLAQAKLPKKKKKSKEPRKNSKNQHPHLAVTPSEPVFQHLHGEYAPMSTQKSDLRNYEHEAL